VGILYPCLQDKSGKLLKQEEFGIIFFNNSGAVLHHGQAVGFHPYLVPGIGKPFVIASDIMDFEAHKRLEKFKEEKAKNSAATFMATFQKLAPQEQLIFQSGIAQENSYEQSASYKQIYWDENGKKRDENDVVYWIMQNALEFSEMNLLKGP